MNLLEFEPPVLSNYRDHGNSSCKSVAGDDGWPWHCTRKGGHIDRHEAGISDDGVIVAAWW